MAVRRAIDRLGIVNPVEVAGDGIEALDRLRGADAGGVRRPFVILLDLNMPRMGGLEFLDHLRSDGDLGGSVVFVMTTSDAPEDIAAAYGRQIAGYILKEDAYRSIGAAISMLGEYVEVVRLPG